MSGPVPLNVRIDPTTGTVTPSTGHYVKRLSDLEGIFHDKNAWAAAASGPDPVVYEVREYRQSGSDLFFGTTTMQPGLVGDEYFMTRGHFHARPDRGETYTTLSGTGLLLLETRDGRTATVEMQPQGTAVIPPGWAHRSVNTGSAPLIFQWVCNVDAGHDYAPIRANGMRQRVLARNGLAQVVGTPDPA